MTQRKLLSYTEAVVAPSQHKSACQDCPFRRDALRGWLGENTPQSFIDDAQGEGRMPCHTTKKPLAMVEDQAALADVKRAFQDRFAPDFEAEGYDQTHWECAGAAIFRANICKRTRDPSLLRLPRDTEKVFSNHLEFIQHHERVKLREPTPTRTSLKRVPNLDGMSAEDLVKYTKSIKRRGKHYDSVRAYCANKSAAMTHRLLGRIKEAKKHEDNCDAIYKLQLQGKVDW